MNKKCKNKEKVVMQTGSLLSTHRSGMLCRAKCMPFAETSIAEQGKQPYKYGGKELDMMSGLNLYDNLARNYDPAFDRTLTMDPLAEKYYPISPYAFCKNNPVNRVVIFTMILFLLKVFVVMDANIPVMYI